MYLSSDEVAGQKQASIRETYGLTFVMGILRIFLHMLTFFGYLVVKAYRSASVFLNANLWGHF